MQLPSFEDIARLSAAEHGDPFAFLGRHKTGDTEVLRCFIPSARQVWVEDETGPMTRFPNSDLFEYWGDFSTIGAHPLILSETDHGRRLAVHDERPDHASVSWVLPAG